MFNKIRCFLGKQERVEFAGNPFPSDKDMQDAWYESWREQLSQQKGEPVKIIETEITESVEQVIVPAIMENKGKMRRLKGSFNVHHFQELLESGASRETLNAYIERHVEK